MNFCDSHLMADGRYIPTDITYNTLCLHCRLRLNDHYNYKCPRVYYQHEYRLLSLDSSYFKYYQHITTFKEL